MGLEIVYQSVSFLFNGEYLSCDRYRALLTGGSSRSAICGVDRLNSIRRRKDLLARRKHGVRVRTPTGRTPTRGPDQGRDICKAKEAADEHHG